MALRSASGLFRPEDSGVVDLGLCFTPLGLDLDCVVCCLIGGTSVFCCFMVVQVFKA